MKIRIGKELEKKAWVLPWAWNTSEHETTGRCCGSLRIHQRHEGLCVFASPCEFLHLPACMWTLHLLGICVAGSRAAFVFLADGCLPPCFCARVFLRARLWEQNNKIWALLGQSLWKLTLAVKSVRVPTVTILSGITAHNLGVGGGGESSNCLILSAILSLVSWQLWTFLAFFDLFARCMPKIEEIQERQRKAEEE